MKNFILGAVFWHICGDFLKVFSRTLVLKLVAPKPEQADV